MKLDQSMMFEWQRHTQEQTEVRDFLEFLDFMDLRARASEVIVRKGQKRHSQTVPSKSSSQTHTVYVMSTDNSCMVCGATKHPLYTCRKFRLLSSEQRILHRLMQEK